MNSHELMCRQKFFQLNESLKRHYLCGFADNAKDEHIP